MSKMVRFSEDTKTHDGKVAKPKTEEEKLKALSTAAGLLAQYLWIHSTNVPDNLKKKGTKGTLDHVKKALGEFDQLPELDVHSADKQRATLLMMRRALLSAIPTHPDIAGNLIDGIVPKKNMRVTAVKHPRLNVMIDAYSPQEKTAIQAAFDKFRPQYLSGGNTAYTDAVVLSLQENASIAIQRFHRRKR